MTRVCGMRRNTRCAWVVAALAAMACHLTTPGPDIASQSLSATDVRRQLLNEADSNYTFGAERTSVAVDTAVINSPGGPLPGMTIATATQVSGTGRLASSKFIARLTSTGTYATMGIAPGTNYVWRDTSSAGPAALDRILIVPRDTAYPMVWLKRDTTIIRYFPAPAPEPRLVKSSAGYGLCQNGCTSGHCAARELSRVYATGDAGSLVIKY